MGLPDSIDTTLAGPLHPAAVLTLERGRTRRPSGGTLSAEFGWRRQLVLTAMMLGIAIGCVGGQEALRPRDASG